MIKDKINRLAGFIRRQKGNKNKDNLIEYLQEQICKYSAQDNTPAEQIKGMNRILRDIIQLDIKVFEGEE